MASRLKSQPQGSNISLKALIPVSRLKSQPGGSNPSLEAQIPALRLKSQPRGSNPSLEAQISALRLKSQPQGSNPSLKAQIPASRLRSQPQALNPSLMLKSAHTDGQTNERTNKSHPVFYRTSSPSGPLPCYPSPTIPYIHIRAMGIADHILPLGDLSELQGWN